MVNDYLNVSDETLEEYFASLGVPRDLYKKTLSVHYRQYPYFTNSIILHEITHFILAKKWLELFPNDTLDDLDAPHAFWHLTEILVPILNGEEKIRLLIPDAEIKSYKKYDEAFDEENPEVSIYGYFLATYLDYKINKKTIEDFLTFSRDEILTIF